MATKKISYVIGVERPDIIRRHLLESARHCIAILQEKKRLEEIRAARKKKIAQLRKTMTSMQKSLDTLGRHVPEQKNRPKIAQRKIPDPVKHAQQLSDLDSVKGIGPSRLKKLQDAGISSVRELAHASVEDLMTQGFAEGVAQSLIDRAHKKDVPESTKRKVVSAPVKPAPEPKRLSEMDILEEKLAAIESKLNNL